MQKDESLCFMAYFTEITLKYYIMWYKKKRQEPFTFLAQKFSWN